MTVLSLNRGNGVGEQSVTWRTWRQVGWKRTRRCHLNGSCKRILEGNAWKYGNGSILAGTTMRIRSVPSLTAEPWVQFVHANRLFSNHIYCIVHRLDWKLNIGWSLQPVSFPVTTFRSRMFSFFLFKPDRTTCGVLWWETCLLARRHHLIRTSLSAPFLIKTPMSYSSNSG